MSAILNFIEQQGWSACDLALPSSPVEPQLKKVLGFCMVAFMACTFTTGSVLIGSGLPNTDVTGQWRDFFRFDGFESRTSTASHQQSKMAFRH